MALIKENQAIDPVKVVEKHGTERHHLMDIVREVQMTNGCVTPDDIDAIAKAMGIHRVEVDGVVGFYHFLSRERSGQTTVYLSKGAVPSMTGVSDVAHAFESAVGNAFGESSPDDPIGLEWTSCIGMSDQEPAAIVDGVIITNLTPDKASALITHLTKGGTASDFSDEPGDGRNASDLIHSMVKNNIRKPGDVIFGDREVGATVKKLVTMEPGDVLEEIKSSNLRGRGGAGFPCGLKWEFTLKANDSPRYVVCNADEGEPGTFKDRVILTERPELVFEGMTTAAYVLGAHEGILYLRHEYEYLRKHLENVLNELRNQNLLGNKIAGKDGFDFDIRIQMGAGAYICGEETSLIESAEGKRGDPRDRPPYPVTYGYMGKPTALNNVETLASAARIIENNALWFKKFGTEKSSGTKLLSISGDCKRPGVYEVPFGITLNEILKEVGGENAQAFQVSGSAGTCIAPADFGRKIAFEDLPTGGSMIVLGPERDLLDVVIDFADFFVEESCGYCTPCRVGTVMMLRKLEKIRRGLGTKSDIDFMKSLGKTIKLASRCGLGQTAANPVTSTIDAFPEIYESRIHADVEFIPEHDMHKALEIGRKAAGFSDNGA